MKRPNKDVLVIGGGAAGMFAAGIAASRGLSVAIIEKNRFYGRKLGITGKGRCNLTNDSTPSEMMGNLTTNGKFLFSALNNFPPAKTMDFFSDLGVKLKTERGKRVFPASDKAADVVNALIRFCNMNGVERIEASAERIITEDGHVSGVLTEKGEFKANSIILATGGLSYPATGSTGDGYRMAEQLGHTIVEPVPSLVPLECEGDVCERMQGFSPRNVELSVYDESGKLIFKEFGEMLFTHFGISGPLTLSASSRMKDYKTHNYKAFIDLKPALDEKTLDLRLQRDFGHPMCRIGRRL